MADQPDVAEATSDDVEELIGLIDRLEAVLQRSQLAEIEVESGSTAIVLRSPAAVAPPSDALAGAWAGRTGGVPRDATGTDEARGAAPDDATLGLHAVLAPLTGIFYASPAPDASPYVRPGAHVAEGQVIGLIEAMKLFNEIKSDVSGKVVRVAAANGALVRAKQPLIEVEVS